MELVLPKIPHILSLNKTEMFEILNSIVSKSYRIKQIQDWIYFKKVIDFKQMTNIPQDLIVKLEQNFLSYLPEVSDIQISSDKTKKFLIKLFDGEYIEMVLMPGKKKNTLCISSQVGCSRKCQFCATAKLGLIRNLKIEELLMQIMLVYKYFPDINLTNIVLMGMGEPLDNYENVISFLKIIQDPTAYAFSGRRVTVSTCGVIPQIMKLADSGIKVKLAVSLNSAIDFKRSIIMPVNDIYNLSELKKSLFYFRKKSAFRITFEYIMIENFNMGNEDIKALVKFCGDISCKINLIKWNAVKGLDWKSPSDEQVLDFINKLSHIPAAITLRNSRGQDINGACGQLAGNCYDNCK
ncbi:MAG: 23S rRNA (adenine(2503)-C(2))-methyltransferase RlmN [Candidatus Cloacimonetes bacterium]|jgi:23S rRNA (adenine2503-C2)-methyltransferase|nr:23S rRNA (adenine(2503)-C(2))-methyltransferase RlmN [Candidatus Cloacimonadota bacterium]MDD4155257.1 23S rRNA (adenine(2503)-C(2))-methyltransferase RlmN [Candidatus Cloacimonadota bacterium]